MKPVTKCLKVALVFMLAVLLVALSPANTLEKAIGNAAYKAEAKGIKSNPQTLLLGGDTASSVGMLSLSEPVSITAAAKSRTSVEINWSAADGAEAYFLKRYNPSTGDWDIIAQTYNLYFTDTNCQPNTTYRYYVVPYAVVDGFVYFAPASDEAVATTPLYTAAPSSVKAVPASRTSVKITWTAAAGADAYFLKRFNTSTGEWDIIAQTYNLYYTDPNCQPNTTYRYHVVAYCVLDGVVRFAPVSDEASAKTPLYVMEPESFTATALSPESALISWSAAAGADAYFLKRYNNSTGEWDIIAQTYNLSFTDNNRTPGGYYRYLIVPYCVIGGVVHFAEINPEAGVTMPRYIYPPASIQVEAKSAYSVKISWAEAANADGYAVKRYNPSTGNWDIVTQILGLSYTDTNCQPNTYYRYHVVSYRNVNGTWHFAPPTEEAALTTPAFGSAPGSFTAKAAATFVTLNWSAAEGANGYFIFRYNPSTSNWDIIAQTNNLSFVDEPCTPNTTYKYYLVPYATAGANTYYAAASNEVTVTTPVVSGPESITAYAVGRNEITVHWDRGDNADGYVLRRALSPEGPFTNIHVTGDCYYTDTNLATDTDYYYDVVAYKVVAGVPWYATPLPAVKVRTKSNIAAYSTAGYNYNRLVGLDMHGRAFGPISGYSSNRVVGVFYWATFGEGAPFFDDIYDVSKIMSKPGWYDKLFRNSTYDSPASAPHYWGEPLWGYYHSHDTYVIRKHIELLTAAGVDFIFSDATNAWTYTKEMLMVMQVIDEMQREGWNPPKVAFYTHSKSLDTTREIYEKIYKKNLYPNTWYRINGKPMIIAYTNVADDIAEAITRGDYAYNPQPLSSEILNFFTFKRPQWPTDPVYSDGFPWIEFTYPQPKHGNIMNVSVGSYPMIPYSFSISRGYNNWGRGYNVSTGQNNYVDAFWGTFFQSSWNTVLNQAVKPEMVTVKGWNEWVASKNWYDGEYVYVDQFNMEYSTDIEMMKGGYEDTFYQLLAKNIRAYKGISAGATGYISKTIDINGSITQWDNVNAIFRDMGTTNYGRNFQNVAGTGYYVQPAPRNNIQEVRVTKDSGYIYFYIRCADTITAPSGTKWMNIFIGTGTPSSKGWQGYNYVVNRVVNGNTTSVEALHSNYMGTVTGNAAIAVNDNVLQVKIPRSALGLGANDNTFYFKVADDVTNPSDIMNFYTTGSCLPMGRLSFQYSD